MSFVDSDLLKADIGESAFNKIFDDGKKSVNSEAVLFTCQKANAWVFAQISPQYNAANIQTDSPGYFYLRLAATEFAKGLAFSRSPEYARRYIYGDGSQRVKSPFDLAQEFVDMVKQGNALLTNGTDVLEAQKVELNKIEDKPSIFGYDSDKRWTYFLC